MGGRGAFAPPPMIYSSFFYPITVAMHFAPPPPPQANTRRRPCVFIYRTWMEGTYDIPNKNPHFFVTTEPNRMGFSPKYR